MKSTDTKLEVLARSLGEALLFRGARVACAESCTGGWISKVLTDIPGSSAWFGWGLVAYANDAKKEALGVPETILSEHGAVSEPVVIAMAKGIQNMAAAEFSVAVSGIAGPGGKTDESPVGTVWFAYGSPQNIQTDCRHFDGDRESVRRQSVAHALTSLLIIVRKTN
jgi:nicotinamide-nucleotide amidase